MEDSMVLMARLVVPACREFNARFRCPVTSSVTGVTDCRSVRVVVVVVMLRLSFGSARPVSWGIDDYRTLDVKWA